MQSDGDRGREDPAVGARYQQLRHLSWLAVFDVVMQFLMF